MRADALKRSFGTLDVLWEQGRIPALAAPGSSPGILEAGVLLFLGAVSAMAVAHVRLDLRIPGHHILFSMFPMALGLSLVPRRFAGTLMGGGALAGLLVGGPGSMGFGAWTGLLLTGPALDLAVRWAKGGLRLHLGVVLAGLAANLGAFAARASASFLGLEALKGGGGGHRAWWHQAPVTYPVCGLLAGLLCALIWFQAGAGRKAEPK